MKKIAFVALTCIAFGAQAASNAGMLDNVVGLVSIGGQGVVAQAKNGTLLNEGSTVLVSSKGKATVLLNNGCAVTLLSSQHFTVNSKLSCEQSIASAKSLMATTRVAQAPVGVGIPPSQVGGSGAAAAAGVSNATAVAAFSGTLVLGIVQNENSSNKASGS